MNAKRMIVGAIALSVLSAQALALDAVVPVAATAAFAQMNALPSVKSALAFIKADDANTLADQKAIVQIPAPTFKEQKRADFYEARFKSLGLSSVERDSSGSVCGLRKGAGNGPTLLLSAHLDTVFPDGTPLAITEKSGRLYAPGIADDSRGLAAMLSVIRAFKASEISTVGDVWFCGTTGEEGLGDLAGIKQVFKNHKKIDGYIAVESPSMENNGITYEATGSHRYRVTYKGPGGHSYQAFGLPSAIHALGRAIAGIADLTVPGKPKTTFTVGTIAGGTSVNSIAGDATMDFDMRSDSTETLLQLETQALKIIEQATVAENKRWNSDKLTVEVKLIGERPAGSPPPDSTVVHALWMAVQEIGGTPKLRPASSTEANLPISLGIPAAVVGGGGYSEGIHSLNEWFNPTDAFLGPQKILLSILSLVGIDGQSPPMLKRSSVTY